MVAWLSRATRLRLFWPMSARLAHEGIGFRSATETTRHVKAGRGGFHCGANSRPIIRVQVIHRQTDDGINLGFSKARFMPNGSAFPIKSLSFEIPHFTMDPTECVRCASRDGATARQPRFRLPAFPGRMESDSTDRKTARREA